MAYTAPISELSFAIQHVIGLERVNGFEKYAEASDELVTAILEEAGRFASEVLHPLNRVGDSQPPSVADGVVTTTPGWKAAYTQFVENGWGQIAAPAEYGGQGLPHLVETATTECWNSANLAFALCPLLTQGAINAIARHGSDALRDQYLPKMITGEWTGTMNLTEPQAGTDLAALRTRAERDGDIYRIFGQKIFITYGEHDMSDNIVHLVLARLPDAPPGVKGISLFLVPKVLLDESGEPDQRNDLKCISLEHKLGIHGSPTCVMSYGDHDGAIGYLIGEEHRGLACMFTMMNQARHHVGVQGYALGELAYQQALGYARDRVQGTPMIDGAKTIINHPDIRRTLMTMRSQVEAMRLLALESAACIDIATASDDADEAQRALHRGELLTPLVKGWSTEGSVEITSLGVQTHGGMGFIEETGAAQHYRDSRILPIYEGTTAIQANDLLGRKLARDNGAATRALLADIDATCKDLIGSGEEKLLAMANQLARANRRMGETLQHVTGLPHPEAFAVSVPLLMAMATLAGGWMQARAALAAHGQMASGDADFLTARIATAAFYMSSILPRVSADCLQIEEGAADAIALPDSAF